MGIRAEETEQLVEGARSRALKGGRLSNSWVMYLLVVMVITGLGHWRPVLRM